MDNFKLDDSFYLFESILNQQLENTDVKSQTASALATIDQIDLESMVNTAKKLNKNYKLKFKFFINLESASPIINQNDETKVPIHQLLLAQYGRKVARGGPKCKHSKQTETFVLSIR